MIYLLTAIGLSPGGSNTHLHTNNTQNDTKQTIHITTQQLDECGPCPVLASYTLAFGLQPRKKHGKTSVRVATSKNTYTTSQQLNKHIQPPITQTINTLESIGYVLYDLICSLEKFIIICPFFLCLTSATYSLYVQEMSVGTDHIQGHTWQKYFGQEIGPSHRSDKNQLLESV